MILFCGGIVIAWRGVVRENRRAMGEGAFVIFLVVLLIVLPLSLQWWRRQRARARWRARGPEVESSGVWNAGDGRAAGIKFGAGFALFGLGFFCLMMGSALVHMVQARWWVQVPCIILSSGVKAHPGDDGGSGTYSIEISYRYSFDGQEYVGDRYHFMWGSTAGESGKQQIVRRYRPDSQAMCWVDPSEPARSVIERGFTADMLYGLIALGFAGSGVGVMIGCWRWGKRV